LAGSTEFDLFVVDEYSNVPEHGELHRVLGALLRR
jgi:hypothetical protein